MNKRQARIGWMMAIVLSVISAFIGIVFQTNKRGFLPIETRYQLCTLLLSVVVPFVLIAGFAFWRAKDPKPSKGHTEEMPK